MCFNVSQAYLGDTNVFELALRLRVFSHCLEPSPHADIPAWKKWLKTMQEHPKSEGKFKYIGIPQVGLGYIKAHIEGVQATTLFIPANNKGICNRGPLRDTILHAAAAAPYSGVVF